LTGRLDRLLKLFLIVSAAAAAAAAAAFWLVSQVDELS